MKATLPTGLLLLALLAGGCRPPAPAVHETLIANKKARVEAGEINRKDIEKISSLAVALMTATLDDLDPTRPGSDIHKLNRVAATVRLQVSHNVFRLIDLAHHYGELTGGAIDITAAPLERAWGIGTAAPDEEPPEELIDGLRAGMGAALVQLSDQGSVAFTSPTTQIALGLLGDAYAVDLAILDLRRREYLHTLVSLGAATRVLGSPVPGQSWSLPIPQPGGATGELGRIRLDAGRTALVLLQPRTPPLQIGDHLYATVLDPRSGRPAEGVALVAVLAPSCTLAHALAQALAVVGLEGAPELLSLFPKCDALLIPESPERAYWLTGGFAERLSSGPATGWSPQPLEAAAPTPAADGASDDPAPAL